MIRWARAISRQHDRTGNRVHPASVGVKRPARRSRRPNRTSSGVLEADEESRLARIALASGPAAQLQVHAAALVPVGPDDVEAAERDHLLPGSRRSTQPDVGAAASHVGGDRDGAWCAGSARQSPLPRRRSSRSARWQRSRRLQAARPGARTPRRERADQERACRWRERAAPRRRWRDPSPRGWRRRRPDGRSGASDGESGPPLRRARTSRAVPLRRPCAVPVIPHRRS